MLIFKHLVANNTEMFYAFVFVTFYGRNKYLH
jgi:hypothetical protein